MCYVGVSCLFSCYFGVVNYVFGCVMEFVGFVFGCGCFELDVFGCIVGLDCCVVFEGGGILVLVGY